jgi:hypothetical protein
MTKEQWVEFLIEQDGEIEIDISDEDMKILAEVIADGMEESEGSVQ